MWFFMRVFVELQVVELKFPSKVLQTWQNIQHWKEALIQILALSACEDCRDSEIVN